MNQLLWKTLFILSAIAFLEINPLSWHSAIAQTTLVPAPSLQGEPREVLSAKEIELPPEVQSAVLEAAATRTSRPVSTLRILEANPRNWSDGCLGLAQPDQLCTQVITPGWRIIVTDGRRNWIYRTDDMGEAIELEESP